MKTDHTKQPRADGAAIVRDHFAEQSIRWGDRYATAPRSMADLDLALRRESVHRMLWPVINASDRKLRVLDVGCGTGDVLDGLPRDLIQVVGMDFVRDMVVVARQTHPGDRFLNADATALPFEDACADVVTSLGVIEYIPSPEAAIASIARVLRPGGTVILSFPNRRSLFRRLLKVERGLDQIIHRLRGRTNVPLRDSSRYPHRQWTVKEAVNLLKSHGFEIEVTLLHTIGPWGRIGRLAPMISVSRLLSRVLCHDRLIAPWLAGTFVVRARTKGAAS